jgi:O-antigen/teichoic acid export membrane protein
MLWRAAFVFLVMAVPVLLLMLLFSDRIMSILTDSAFAPGRVIIPFVILSAIFSGVAAIMSDTLTLHNRTVDLALCYFAGLTVNLVCDLILIPPYGIIGCAWSTLIAFATLAVVVILRAHVVARVLDHFWPALKAVMRIGYVSA